MEIAVSIALLLLLALVGAWLVARYWLAGESMERWDAPRPAPVNAGAAPSAGLAAVRKRIAQLASAGNGLQGKARLSAMRDAMDTLAGDLDAQGIQIHSVDVDGVPAEWVLAANSDPNQRLLYLHGGAFTIGSPVSHRRITAQFAQQMGLSVLCIDYRLMPEHQRLDCLRDACTAYHWVTKHAPDGNQTPPSRLFVAGDSAGGNLTLAVIAWARDNNELRADAAIALSPATDSTFASPSLVANIATDEMLGPTLGKMMRLPRSVLLWAGLLANRTPPANPAVSPLHGDLSGLPPTLIQLSESEMLRDDGARYAAKAQASGSTVELQSWDHMPHVWPIFVRELDEAGQAFEQMARFLQQHCG